ncbi:hypothetical protein [Mameliella alba]|uniref:Uncharacterized protein n=1 Tax=Mameliella alba TaxID=561184 RepID=A0A0B3RRG4_9RHOB|nr:hypothetical protein [Mameliella alba]KHQ50462.1 hypothetical protein OA50_04970 [Mameliella alba]
MTVQSAAEIYQANLDVGSRMFFAGDLDRIGSHIAVPCAVHTQDSSQRIERLEDLLVMLREQPDSLRRLGTTEYHRICIKAEFTDPTGQRIRGQHGTYLLRGGSYLMERSPCEQLIELQGDDWKALDLDRQMRNSDLTMVGPQLMEHLRRREAQPDKGES